MQATADYHTHSVYSHGKGSIEENVQAAFARGLTTIGITDHGPGHFFIGVGGVSAFRRMQEEIVRLRVKYPLIEILLGVEANIVDVDGTIDVPLEIMDELDFLLVGYHKLVRPRSLAALLLGVQNFLAGWLHLRPLRLRRQNTAAICAAVRRYPIKAITHPGLQIDIDTVALAHVCVEQGTLMEINSSYGKELDGYVKTALPTGAMFVVNSDAHTPARVGDFSAAYELIERLDVPVERVINISTT
ncbi:MAG: PHP domain-containing protein [Firmicutes bacterium]|nr:PHP domain-containing protein [Bacillota bacterium]